MTLDERIGATLAVGFHGTEATGDLADRLRRLHARSLVVFSRNFTSPEQFTALVSRLNESLGRRLLVMVDHEGGRVVRFGSGVTRFPDARSVGRTEPPEAIERQGAVEAQELLRLGVRVNLAPCVDVIVEGSDPIIGDRSYGVDPARVTACALARIRGLQSHGVSACAKHFPGLGAVPRDPHKMLPTISLSPQAMADVHWPPFRAAIEAGVAMVMSSHVCYPGLGEPAERPATFSPTLISGLLRKQMGFAGLILTDDLEMGALKAFGTMGELAVEASGAGHDLLLICSDLDAAQQAFDALRLAYQTGRLSQEALSQSVERLLKIQA